MKVSVAVFLTPEDLSQRYGVPLATVYQWRLKAYGPKGIRVGKHVRYSLGEVERWEREQVERVAS